MEYVICDTMIWYYLGSGKIKRPPKSKVKLIATSVSIREFGVTPNIRVNRIEYLTKAVDSITKYSDYFILTNPFDYLVSHFDGGFTTDDDAEKKLLEKFESLQIMNTSKIPLEVWEETYNQIQEIKSPIRAEVDHINNEVLPIRRAYRKKHYKKADDYRRLDFSLETRQYISDVLMHFAKNHLSMDILINPEDKKWNEFEIFLRVWETFHKELDIGSEKLKENDWTDMFNMVYR